MRDRLIRIMKDAEKESVNMVDPQLAKGAKGRMTNSPYRLTTARVLQQKLQSALTKEQWLHLLEMEKELPKRNIHQCGLKPDIILK